MGRIINAPFFIYMNTKQDIGSKGFTIASFVLIVASWFLKGPFMYFNALALIFTIVGIWKGIREHSVLWTVLAFVALFLSYEVFLFV